MAKMRAKRSSPDSHNIGYGTPRLGPPVDRRLLAHAARYVCLLEDASPGRLLRLTPTLKLDPFELRFRRKADLGTDHEHGRYQRASRHSRGHLQAACRSHLFRCSLTFKRQGDNSDPFTPHNPQ